MEIATEEGSLGEDELCAAIDFLGGRCERGAPQDSLVAMSPRALVRRLRWFGFVLLMVLCEGGSAQVTVAPTPPMGWNSWDSFGTAVTEQDVRANAAWMAEHLKPFGWQYVVVDEEWFARVPAPQGGGDPVKMQLSMDAYGRYVPAKNRFPSAAHGAGMAPLAAYVHSLGLKFGIHLLQGVPRLAVEQALPIADSRFTAKDAADPSQHCSWSHDNFDGKDTAAGQAYYDALLQQVAGWGVDLIKVDCISSRPYKGAEIAMVSRAIAKTGRPMALSLSPGEMPLDKVEDARGKATMWRISDDMWDIWHSDVAYPQGLGDQIPRLARWSGQASRDRWSDADMLPLGYLGPTPGWGAARWTRLTHDEQQTLVTLWCMFRSPLMVGGDLPKTDAWTLGLLTNREVLAIDQSAEKNHPVDLGEGLAVWVAERPDGSVRYVSITNMGDVPRKLTMAWGDLGLRDGPHAVQDLWLGRDFRQAKDLRVSLRPHASTLYAVRTAGD